MPEIKKGPRLSTTDYYTLESYLFKLSLYTDSEEYYTWSLEDRKKIDEEILRMTVAIDVMNIFRNSSSLEKPIIAWKKLLDHENDHRRLFRFTTNTVAAQCLSVSGHKIKLVCEGERHSAGGYVFQYEEDYEKEPETIYSTGIKRIKAPKI